MKPLDRRVRTLETERGQSSPWGPILDQLTVPELERLKVFLPRLIGGEPLEALEEGDQGIMMRMEAMRWGN